VLGCEVRDLLLSARADVLAPTLSAREAALVTA
jgi:hypothetical protein